MADLLTKEMVESMADDPIIFAMANPNPEIKPDIAKAAGAKVAISGLISGLGFAIAKIIGSSAIDSTISFVNKSATETPINTSAS